MKDSQQLCNSKQYWAHWTACCDCFDSAVLPGDVDDSQSSRVIGPRGKADRGASAYSAWFNLEVAQAMPQGRGEVIDVRVTN